MENVVIELPDTDMDPHVVNEGSETAGKNDDPEMVNPLTTCCKTGRDTLVA